MLCKARVSSLCNKLDLIFVREQIIQRWKVSSCDSIRAYEGPIVRCTVEVLYPLDRPIVFAYRLVILNSDPIPFGQTLTSAHMPEATCYMESATNVQTDAARLAVVS